MPSAMYPSAKKLLLDGDLDLLVDTIKAALVTSSYTYSSAHDFYDDLSGVIGTDQTLGSKDTTAGAFDAADSTWPAVTGAPVGIVLYKDTGVAGTSPLIAFLDGAGWLDLVGTMAGAPLAVTWDNGSNKIFKLN